MKKIASNRGKRAVQKETLPVTTPDPAKLITSGYTSILGGLAAMGYDVDKDPNFENTAERASKALRELVWSRERVEEEVEKILSVSFPLNAVKGRKKKSKRSYNVGDMVVCRGRVFFSICPHHLLPVAGVCNLAYIPQDNNVLGISKLARLVDIVSKQAVLQEDFVAQIADHLFYTLDSGGSAVIADAVHMCMSCRGPLAHESSVTVAALRGAFENHAATRGEFYSLLQTPRTSFLAGGS